MGVITVPEARNTDFQKAQAEAQRVLRENFVQEPPVVVYDIARNYGLEVRESLFGDEHRDIMGYIKLEDGVVYVNKLDSGNRRRFTVAHELGHWLMHKEDLHRNPDEYAILYRRPLGVEVDPVEQEANCFAANLLVPFDLLKKHRDKPHHEIAALFQVSPEVIGYRISRC